MAGRFKALDPLVAYTVGGKIAYAYRGTVFQPSDDDAKRLVALGVVEPVDEVAPATLAPAAAPVGIPPKQGPGSGKAAWLAYADSVSLQVAEELDRDGVIAALVKAGKPT